MATVSQLKQGLWVVHWIFNDRRKNTAERDDVTVVFTIPDRGSSFQLSYNCIFDTCFTFRLNHAQGDISDADRPEKVTAFLDGEERIMKEISRAVWITKPNIYVPRLHGNLDHKYCSVLVLDYNPAGERYVLNSLSNMLTNQSHADMRFVIENQEFSAHMGIVASASPVMSNLITRIKDYTTNKIDIANTSAVAFKQILRFIYTGAVTPDQPTDEMEALLVAAQNYQMEELADSCQDKLIYRLSRENCVHLLEFALCYSTSKLRDYSFRFITRHQEVLNTREWKELLSKHPDLSLEFSRYKFIQATK